MHGNEITREGRDATRLITSTLPTAECIQSMNEKSQEIRAQRGAELCEAFSASSLMRKICKQLLISLLILKHNYEPNK